MVTLRRVACCVKTMEYAFDDQRSQPLVKNLGNDPIVDEKQA